MKRIKFRIWYNNNFTIISVLLIIFYGFCFSPLFSLFWPLDDIILLSTLPVVVKGGNTLHNEYVVGLCDAEATFTISVTKDNRTRKTSRSLDNSRTIYSVHPSFAISLNIKDWHLICSLQSFFGIGNIKKDLRNNAITFYVNSVEDLLNVVIPFFKAHSLLARFFFLLLV